MYDKKLVPYTISMQKCHLQSLVVVLGHNHMRLAFKILKDHGADLNPGVFASVYEGNDKSLEALMTFDINVCKKNQEGLTPLMIAIGGRYLTPDGKRFERSLVRHKINLKIVKMLLSDPSNIFLTDDHDRTALELCKMAQDSMYSPTNCKEAVRLIEEAALSYCHHYVVGNGNITSFSLPPIVKVYKAMQILKWIARIKVIAFIYSKIKKIMSHGE